MIDKETAGLIDRNAGARLRAIRSERGVSQTALGDAIGVTFQQVQKYEKGTNRISLSMLVSICQALGCHPMDIIGEDAATARVDLPDHTAEIAQLRAAMKQIGKAVHLAGVRSELAGALFREGARAHAEQESHAAHTH